MYGICPYSKGSYRLRLKMWMMAILLLLSSAYSLIPKKKHDWVKHCKVPIFVDKLQYVIGFGVHFYVLKHQNLVCTTTIFATSGFMNSQPPAS